MDSPPVRTSPPESWARRHAAWVAVLSVLIAGWDLALGPTPWPSDHAPAAVAPAVPTRMLSQCDIAQIGNDAALAYLRHRNGVPALRSVEAARTAVVRFQVSARSPERNATISNSGSGVLVNGGRHLLVAGHVLDTMKDLPEPEFSVILNNGLWCDGRGPVVRGGIAGAPEGDWGLVELKGPPEGRPSLRWGTLALDATVVMLGYSDDLGVDAAGKVHRNQGQPGILPLAFVGKISNLPSCKAEIVAGLQPGGGSSGGAIIDLEGKLIGVMHSWSWVRVVIKPSRHNEVPWDEQTTGDNDPDDIWFNGTPVDVFRAFIEERWKR